MDELWKWITNNIGQLVATLGVLGIAIDFTPFIKIQPIRMLLAWIGNQLNKDLKSEIAEIKTNQTKLSKSFESHKLESQRYEILDFANSCMNHIKHTKEEFDHIIEVHDDYDKYVTVNKISNGKVKLAYEYIEDIYHKCLVDNSFLGSEPIDPMNDKN